MNACKPHKRSRSRGYTLMELVISSAVSTVLLGGMSTSLYIAAKSLDVGQSDLAVKRAAQGRLAEMHRDIASAISFSELTATSAAMIVPDRDGDGTDESIRYAWSGSAGDPLTQEYNGGAVTTVVASVDNFAFDWDPREIEGFSDLPVVLFVVSSASLPNSSETDRANLIEGWGYDVEMLSDQSSLTAYELALEESDVVYVSSRATESNIGTKLTASTLGIVTEQRDIASELGFASSTSVTSHTSINIADASHEITATLSTGVMDLAASDIEIQTLSGTIAPSLSTLATRSGDATLAALESGNSTYDGGMTAGRRIFLPWNHTAAVADLSYDAKTIMQNALTWALGSGGSGSGSGSGTGTGTGSGSAESGSGGSGSIELGDGSEGSDSGSGSGGSGAGGSPSGLAFQGFTETQGGNDDLITISTPSGVAEGDLLIAALAMDGDRTGSISAASGWNVIDIGAGDGDCSLSVWWKLAEASEASSQTFTWSSNEKSYGWIMRFTGHDNADPIHGFSTDEGRTATPSSPAVTTSIDDCLILRLGAFDDDDINTDAPGLAGHTAITMDESSGGSGTSSGGAGYLIQASAGNSGTSSFDLTASEQFRTVTIAIAPETGP